MSLTLEREQRALAAVRLLAEAADARADMSGPMNYFLEATGDLPVSRLGDWERRIRNEIHLAPLSSGRRPLAFLPFANRFAVPWLDLSSGDGFRRERAMRAMTGAAPNAFLFAMLLRRLNDWVAQVRAAARDTVPGVAASSPPEIIVAALWGVLPNLSSWGRLETMSLNTVADLVADGRVASQLARSVIASPAGPGATILAQAGRRESVDRFLPTIAAEAIQPAVRAKAYKCLLENRITWCEGRIWTWTDKAYCEGRYEPVVGGRTLSLQSDYRTMLKKALCDRSPVVRRVAGDALIRHRAEMGADAIALARRLSADPYPSLAERGDFILKNTPAA